MESSHFEQIQNLIPFPSDAEGLREDLALRIQATS